jgi:hypothetical protein
MPAEKPKTILRTSISDVSLSHHKFKDPSRTATRVWQEGQRAARVTTLWTANPCHLVVFVWSVSRANLNAFRRRYRTARSLVVIMPAASIVVG